MANQHGRVEQAALGTDLPHEESAEVQAHDPRVAAVQHPEPVHPRLDIEVGPDLAVDQHVVAEVLTDPGHARDGADRVAELPVRAELAVLDDQRYLAGAAG